MRSCAVCPEKLSPTARADARFCSTRCRVRAHRANLIPSELTVRPRWVRWRSVRRHGKFTRVPITVAGAPAKSTDPATWSSFPEARRSRAGDGIGFALGEGIGCIDLDHCLDGGELAPWAVEILGRCPATYVEVSPSGDGLHVWGWLAEGPGRKIRGSRSVEVYSAGRYMTVTGRPFAGSVSTLADLTEVAATI